VIYIRTKVDESPAWLRSQVSKSAERRLGKDILTYLGTFTLLVVLMFAFNSFSHGTQDLYPTFLTKGHQFGPQTVMVITVTANIGALLGGVLFGTWSEKIGRRRAIVIAALLAIPVIRYGLTRTLSQCWPLAVS
jgi:SHS family lactate transporter-like MFS transporter